MQPVGLIQFGFEAAGGAADLAIIGLHPELCQTGRTPIEDAVQPERRRFAAVTDVRKDLVLIVQDRAFQRGVDLREAHRRDGLRVKELFGADQDAARTKTGSAPFREALVGTVLRDLIDRDVEFLDQLRGPIRHLQRMPEAGQAALREQHDDIAGLFGAQDAEDRLDVRTEHFLGDHMHFL